MFYDRAKIYVRSGDGGDGHISFRREKFVAMGGPDGGDGGDGGDVIVAVNPNLNSLVYFHRHVHFKAGHGRNGGTTRKTGRRGEAVRLEVPPGTIIRTEETGELLADMTEPDQEVVLLPGGRAGRGNSRFATSVNQAPRIGERGEPGKEMWITLELKLIADVGLVGKPNAGKSTLLSVVSAARPKIASYPFTTLQPNLGVVALDDYTTFVMADIPGLIEGASQGIGLGHDFLRHIERTRVIVHLLDGAAADPLEDWALINQELARYDASLTARPQLVVLNKLDLRDGTAWEPILREEITAKGYPFTAISAVTGEGVREMLYQVKQMLDALPPPAPAEETIVITPEPDENAFEINREGEAWRVTGVRVERLAAQTYWEFSSTVERFQRLLERMGVSEALRDAGVREGDLVRIADQELEWSDEQ